MTLLGAEVRRRLAEASISQADLAAMLGCSEKHTHPCRAGYTKTPEPWTPPWDRAAR